MNEFIVAVIFRLLNFAGLIALFVYLFKKYALEVIAICIVQQESLVRALFNRQDELEVEQRALDEQVVYEAQLCAELKEKIAQWKNLVDQDLAAREHVRADRIKLLSQHAHQHAQNYAMNKAKRQVLSQVSTHVRDTMTKQFTDAKEGQKFLEPIINFMRKSTS